MWAQLRALGESEEDLRGGVRLQGRWRMRKKESPEVSGSQRGKESSGPEGRVPAPKWPGARRGRRKKCSLIPRLVGKMLPAESAVL